jgi:hypothetical protein
MKHELVATKVELVATQAKLVSKDSDLIASEADRIVEIASLIASEAQRVPTCHLLVAQLLTSLRTVPYETSLLTSEIGESQHLLIHDPDRCAAELPCLSEFEKLCNPDALDLDKWEHLPILEPSDKVKLTLFFKDLQPIVRSVSLLDVNAEEYSEQIGVAVKGIMEWNSNGSAQSTTGFYIPSCVGQETIGVESIFVAIIVKLTQILGLVSRMPVCRDCSSHEDDFVRTSPEEEHLLAILSEMLGVPIAVKPITRKNATATELLLEAQNEVIAQLATQAMFSLDFGGIGKDCEVFGLAVNMVSVTVVVLKLSSVGTHHVKVTAQRTTMLPLYDKQVMDVEDISNEAERKGDDMPQGFCLLARVLVSVSNRLSKSLTTNTEGSPHCSLKSDEVSRSIEVGKALGSGAFSNVFTFFNKDSKSEDHSDMFIKVSKSYEMKASLGIEATALKDLSENIHIPNLFDTKVAFKTLSIKIMCESSELPCLPLRGFIGIAASKQKRWTDAGLIAIFLQVKDALVFANRKGWAHLDVRPSNIITRFRPGTDCFDVMLIDWGCAHRTNAELMGFVGCPPYAHDELFDQPKKLHPCLNHDLASLTYTLACLKYGSIPWVGNFSDHLAVSANIRKERVEEASQILMDSNISVEIKEMLLQAIDPMWR